ncbi:Cro/Cl family transcriptional regulator [Amylibacter marinus]|uniref:Cro/Cl family transcriptional regulator n=1 Tax=Amylibacter marinus TaxID=1475483 RepID=A0ABQ5VVW9_9RHOB|nr:helix-turn-helix transcriptional regulator [Amylibacter marinus]GLQ35577.1 Cro/Cl family transcriptional regulator [Amylibacter marinus]
MDRKIFAGPRVKRLRMARNLSQTAMAKELEISASYLNLIERNQRPLTVQLILKLSKTYNVTPEELHGDTDGSVNALKEVFADALLKDELPGYEELFELADVAPNVASGIQKLHHAYRQSLDQLSELNALLAKGGAEIDLGTTGSPHDQVFQAMAGRANYYDALDRACEEMANSFDPARGLWTNLVDWLAKEHHINVQMLPEETMPEWRHHYDRHSARLFISDRLGVAHRLLELASFVVHLAFEDKIESAVLRLNLRDQMSQELGANEMARYGALAILMPYRRFYTAAVRAKYNVTVLAGRFDVPFELIARRLTSLGRMKMQGAPFFMIVGDGAGNQIALLGTAGFPRIEFGGRCPKLKIYRADERSLQLCREVVEMPNGDQFLTLTKANVLPDGVSHRGAKQTTTMLVCDAKEAMDLFYDVTRRAIPVGPNCRLCDRGHCAQRAEAPITQPIAISKIQRSISDFEFKS